MNLQQLNGQSIILEQGLKHNQIITKLGIVFYKRFQLHKLEFLLKKKCIEYLSVSLIVQGDHFWLIKACEQESQAQYQQIQRIVGLTQTIVCIDLPNNIESFVQKAFWKTKNQSSAYISNNRLIFIKEIYNNKQNSSEIRYFRDIKQALFLLQQKNFFNCSPITIADLLQLFDCEKPENISKVKAIYIKYQQIRKNSEKVENVNKMIFGCQKSKIEVLKEIQKLNLPKFQQMKLIWKMKQMSRYQQWLQQEKQSLQINCGKFTFHELNQRIGFNTIFRYKKQWSNNSFVRLKQFFNKINGFNDAAAIKDFEKEYNSMREKLQKIIKRLGKAPECSLLSAMVEDLDQFYNYHHGTFINSPFSSFGFLKGEACYIWKYNNNIYKKAAGFVLFGGLAYCQQDLHRAVTFLILAILILSLRC